MPATVETWEQGEAASATAVALLIAVCDVRPRLLGMWIELEIFCVFCVLFVFLLHVRIVFLYVCVMLCRCLLLTIIVCCRLFLSTGIVSYHISYRLFCFWFVLCIVLYYLFCFRPILYPLSVFVDRTSRKESRIFAITSTPITTAQGWWSTRRTTCLSTSAHTSSSTCALPTSTACATSCRCAYVQTDTLGYVFTTTVEASVLPSRECMRALVTPILHFAPQHFTRVEQSGSVCAPSFRRVAVLKRNASVSKS